MSKLSSNRTGEKHDIRMTRYRAGMSDHEIARIEGVDRSSIRGWRKVRNLPPHFPAPKEKPTRAPQSVRMANYRSGMNDRQMADAEGVEHSTIWAWRKRNKLPPNVLQYGALSEDQMSVRLTAYDRGETISDIAELCGMSKKSIHKWLKRSGLSLKKRHEYATMTQDQHAARMLLYSFGYSDARIGREQSRNSRSIFRWRKRHGLAPNSTTISSNEDRAAKLMHRIKAALPKYLSPADRDDALSDLFEAVLSGAIPIEEIERRAKRYGNKVIESYASKWGDRSLNEELGDDGDGFTMIDMIADERSSSWLEEMGATVW